MLLQIVDTGQNQIQLNTVDSLILTAQRKPQVNGLGLVMIAPVLNGWGYDEAITNGGAYSAMVAASQNIFTKKIFRVRSYVSVLL